MIRSFRVCQHKTALQNPDIRFYANSPWIDSIYIRRRCICNLCNCILRPHNIYRYMELPEFRCIRIYMVPFP